MDLCRSHNYRRLDNKNLDVNACYRFRMKNQTPKTYHALKERSNGMDLSHPYLYWFIWHKVIDEPISLRTFEISLVLILSVGSNFGKTPPMTNLCFFHSLPPSSSSLFFPIPFIDQWNMNILRLIGSSMTLCQMNQYKYGWDRFIPLDLFF